VSNKNNRTHVNNKQIVMKRQFIILLALIVLVINFSCQKDKNSEDLPFGEPKGIDTVKLIYQHIYNDNLLMRFDTQTIYVKNSIDTLYITSINNYDKSLDTTIIIFDSENYNIKRLPISEGEKCSILNIVEEASKFGKILNSQCWNEYNGHIFPDSGVEVLYSTLYGDILSRGHFGNYGHVIYSIDGEKIPKSQKLALISQLR